MIWIDRVLVSEGEPGVYGEKTLQDYRVWDPYRSKLSALYYLGKGIELEKEMKVLYLGAANGTTVSHVADYTQCVYAVEFAPRPMQDLLAVAKRRKNVIPIMADATRPETYAPFLEEVDLVYQDVASPEQAQIALRNSIFLKKTGTLIVVLKTRSIDVTRQPEDVLADVRQEFGDAGLFVDTMTWILPYHRDHAALVCRKV